MRYVSNLRKRAYAELEVELVELTLDDGITTLRDKNVIHLFGEVAKAAQHQTNSLLKAISR